MKTTAIHSKILNETIYLSEIEVPGHVCYSEKEIKFLRACEKNMKPERYALYLRQVHLVKKTFPGAKIEDIKMEAPAGETVRGNHSVESQSDLGVEDAEQLPGLPTIQKSL